MVSTTSQFAKLSVADLVDKILDYVFMAYATASPALRQYAVTTLSELRLELIGCEFRVAEVHR